MYIKNSGTTNFIYIDGRYREQKYFKEKVLYFVFNIVELNPTDKVGSMIHEFLKTLFEKPHYDVVFIDKSATKSFRSFAKTTGQLNVKNKKS